MAAPIVTQDELLASLKYDEQTGEFTWLVSSGKAKAGQPAGSVKPNGYLNIGLNGRVYRAHRLAFLYMTGRWPAHHVDHVNGCRLDNRWSNLRDVPRQVNSQNRRTAGKNCKSGILGVRKVKNRWVASLKLNGKTKHVGSYDTVDEAEVAYVAAKRQVHEGCTL